MKEKNCRRKLALLASNSISFSKSFSFRSDMSSNNHFSKYKYYLSHDLLQKVNFWCKDCYLNSIQYATIRETLRERIGYLSNFIHDSSKKCLEGKTQVESILIEDYKLYCRFNCKDIEAVIDVNNPDMRTFFKKLYKKLFTALNRFDKSWGYYGVRGYGMNYGRCHIEQERNIVQVHRRLNVAVECLKKIAAETRNKDCLQALKELESDDL